jgi:hypothetical protein
MMRVAVGDLAEFDTSKKRLIAAVLLKNVMLRLAMEWLKETTAFSLSSRIFRDRQDGDASL